MPELRPRHHVTPPTGRLNDPNGVYLDGDTLHVYYQHDPGFPHAQKRTGWGHTSTPLRGPGALTWQHHPNALHPDVPYDRDGCYSGSAVVVDGQVLLYYTGNLKVDGVRHVTQNLVTVGNPSGPEGGLHLRHPGNPLIDGPAPGFTSEYRDPQITPDPNGGWRMVLGAQGEDGTGGVAMYSSSDLMEWHHTGRMTFDTSNAEPGNAPDIIPSGYMWECPNLITMRDEISGEHLDVLVFCPQGITPRTIAGITHYASQDQCGYVVGKLRGSSFEVLRGFSELDLGHEFYAPQVITTGDRGLLIGWMGLPGQDDQPTLPDAHWVHCLTIPRTLSLRQGRLFQELILPEAAEAEADSVYGKTSVIRRRLGAAAEELRIAENVNLSWTPGTLTVTRGDDSRTMVCPEGELVVLIDASAIELTAGDGAVACALRTFPGV